MNDDSVESLQRLEGMLQGSLKRVMRPRKASGFRRRDELSFGIKFARRYQIGNRVPRSNHEYEAWDHELGRAVLLRLVQGQAKAINGAFEKALDWGVADGKLFVTYAA